MASNALRGGSTAWPGGSAFSSAAVVGAKAVPLKASSAEDSRSVLPPDDGAVTAIAAATGAVGSNHCQPTPALAPSNPLFPGASPGTGSEIETGQVQGGMGKGMRVVLLEAEVGRAHHHNMQLQHHITFLNAQMSSQLGHIAGLHRKVMALESELKSLKANVAIRAGSCPATSEAVNSVASESVPVNPAAAHTASATPVAPPAPSPAIDLDQPLPDKQPTPALADADAPGIVGDYALWDLRPKSACASGPKTVASTVTGLGGSGAVSPEGAPAAAAVAGPLPLSPEKEAPAECSSSEPGRVHVTPSAEPTAGTETASVEPSVELDGKTSSGDYNSTAAERKDVVSDTEPDVAVNTNPPAIRSVKSRNSLSDFWGGSNDPPSCNTRNRRHRAPAVGPVRQQQRGKSASPPSQAASHLAKEGTPKPSEAVRTAQDHVGVTPPTAEGRETPHVARTAKIAAQIDQDVRAKVDPTALRRATEGREGAEDRSSHLMDCCFCQGPLPEGESIGRCDACPRSFCTQCLEHSLLEEGVDYEGLDRGSRAMLEGKHGDFFIAQCPRCISGCDSDFSAPQGVPPMEHLLNELLRHDLSICFREPVDIIKHPDYIEAIGRDAMIDLGTMLSKLKGKKYPRRRGPGQFMEDLNRIWRNCRRFAGCDDLGKPHYGTTVPGIVRCAITLEAMQRKFCDAYPVSDNQGQAWQESTWSFHRQRQERENAEARLKQLDRLENKDDYTNEKPSGSAVGGGGLTAATGRERKHGSSSIDSSGEKPDGGSSRASPSTQQHAAEDCAGGRKRRAAVLEKAAQEASLKRTRSRLTAARTIPGANVRDSDDGGTPIMARGVAGNIKQEQSPWSPLDKLCDLATTFVR